MNERNALTSFINSMYRLVENRPVFKHRPLKAITVNFHRGIRSIHLARVEDGVFKGYVDTRAGKFDLNVKENKLIIGTISPDVFDLSDKAGITHHFVKLHNF